MNPKKKLTQVAAIGALLTASGALGAGCLTRPVSTTPPATKSNFTTQVKQAGVDKVDLLFMIDNSASMGDKQALLADTVPDLVSRLLTPNCVAKDPNDPKKLTVTGTAGADGKCSDSGSKPEFQPISDIHIGIVSSSIGAQGADQCKDTDGSTHNNDRARLISRGKKAGNAGEFQVNEVEQSGFLAWFPDNPATDNKTKSHEPYPKNPVKIQADLESAFADMVRGVRENGCGFEAQLESFYRFLIQPDPYPEIVRDGNTAKLQDGVDEVILQQRADFLRADSLVAIVLVTDENESTVDPLAINGQGWAFESTDFPGSSNRHAPKATSACADPAKVNTGDCTSCAFNDSDPACSPDKYYNDQDDKLNVRFFHMKQRFGIDPQFPISRYINGLTQQTVPNRDGEHPLDKDNRRSPGYVGNGNCVNPLFAKNLPTKKEDDLCHLDIGSRTPDLVFFAVIGGVPWQLLVDGGAPYNGEFKDTLNENDFEKILGKDPLNYDFSGADPHMLESILPRTGLPQPNEAASDPFHGREWTTDNADLQYACTFTLPEVRDCANSANTSACDCIKGTNGNVSDSPLCEGTNQVRGKAYPTIREFEVVRKLGEQGIMASICPRTLDKSNKDYGYRPAVRAIIDRLKNALAAQCLLRKLAPVALPNVVPPGPDAKGVRCLVLATLPDAVPGGNAQSKCNEIPGMSQPEAAVLAKFQEQLRAERGDAGKGDNDPKNFPTCQLQQYAFGSDCSEQGKPGWCYVEGEGGASCSQRIQFTDLTKQGVPVGVQLSLQCIDEEQADAGTVGK